MNVKKKKRRPKLKVGQYLKIELVEYAPDSKGIKFKPVLLEGVVSSILFDGEFFEISFVQNEVPVSRWLATAELTKIKIV